MVTTSYCLRSNRKLPWSMRVLNLFGHQLIQMAWIAVAVGVIGTPSIPTLPPKDTAEIFLLAFLAFGIIGIVMSIIRCRRINRLLSTGAVARGRIVNVQLPRSSANHHNKWMIVTATFAFTAADGQEYITTAELPAGLGSALRVGSSLLRDIARQVILHTQERGTDDQPNLQQIVKELQHTDLFALIQRISVEGWDTVASDYSKQFMDDAITTAKPLQSYLTGGPSLTPQEIDERIDTMLQGLTVDKITSLQTSINEKIDETTTMGKIAEGVIGSVFQMASFNLRDLLSTNGELIFYDPKTPDGSALPEAALPYPVDIDFQGVLNGGNFLNALRFLVIPTIVILYMVVFGVPRLLIH